MSRKKQTQEDEYDFHQQESRAVPMSKPCSHCQSTLGFVVTPKKKAKGIHQGGVYCYFCLKWQKWISKLEAERARRNNLNIKPSTFAVLKGRQTLIALKKTLGVARGHIRVELDTQQNKTEES